MKILYITDLHGNKAKYKRVLELAITEGVQAVINGGDMLPKNGSLHFDQHVFIENFLDSHFADYETAGIYHIGLLGNDDLKIHDELFQSTCSKYSHVINIAQSKIQLGTYEFIGMNWVVDYPFQLKDRCRKDNQAYTFQEQLGSGLLSKSNRFEVIDNWFSYSATLPTIEDELCNLPKPSSSHKTVYVIHMPPSKVGLDECLPGNRVGSDAIHSFILKNQPLLTLHGHIHESPECSGIWMAQIDKTVCVQPGQFEAGKLIYVLCNLDSMDIRRFEE